MADALDSKSSVRKGVWVRLPPSVLETEKALTALNRGCFFRFYSPFERNPTRIRHSMEVA